MANEPESAADGLTGRKSCRHCGSSILAGATRCPHCQSPQGRSPLWRRPLAWVAAATTIFSLIFSVHRLHGAWSSGREIERAVAEHVATARTLAAAGDRATAWRSLETARSLDSTAKAIGTAQIEVASAWLLAAGARIGWLPTHHPSQKPGADTSGVIADTVYVSLVAAAMAAEGTDRADLEGLAAWARYLRGRERFGRRRDITPDLEAALEHDPDAYYPNLFLGFWHAAMRANPAAAQEPWARALEAARARDAVPYLRSMQLFALGRHVENTGSSPSERATNRAARTQYLRTLDQMRKAGESPVNLVWENTFAALFLERLARDWRKEYFAEMLDVVPVADQLAIVDWLRSALDLEPGSFGVVRLHLIRGLMLEELGRMDDAREDVAAARAGKTGHLRDLIDETWARLTGQEFVREDEWAARAHHLERAPFDSPEVQEALEALGQRSAHTLSFARDSLLLAVDAAIARVSAELASGDPSAAVAGTPRIDLETSLRSLRHLRGATILWVEQFGDGARELEALLLDPALSPELRQHVNLDLAQNYAYSPRAVPFDSPQSDVEHQVAMVYSSEGLDRLGAALDAGSTDWAWIEAYLKALRVHPGYIALSLRHNRIPPRDEEDD